MRRPLVVEVRGKLVLLLLHCDVLIIGAYKGDVILTRVLYRTRCLLHRGLTKHLSGEGLFLALAARLLAFLLHQDAARLLCCRVPKSCNHTDAKGDFVSALQAGDETVRGARQSRRTAV